MKSKPRSFMIILMLVPFFFAAHDCHAILSRDVERTVQKMENYVPMIDLSNQGHFEGDIKLPEGTPSYSAVYYYYIWPTKKIPYIISPVYTKDQVNLILDAMNAFKSRTCIEFVPRTDEKDYIEIKKTGVGCYSYAGRYREGGNQTVSLDNGCLFSHTIKHELMHAVGFLHEQSRTDRDDFVKINFENIEAGMEFNFQKYDSNAVQLLGTPYDLKSIMHYDSYDFAKDKGKPTITDKIGNTVEPSHEFAAIDLLDLNRLYQCPNYKQWKDQNWKTSSFIWGSNCDIVGLTIRKVNSTRFKCGGMCATDLNCTVFTWESNGICTLKTGSKQAETLPLKGATCGWITEGNSNFEWKDYNNGQERRGYTCYFPGKEISKLPLAFDTIDLLMIRRVRLLDTCFSQCISEPKCTGYFVRFNNMGTYYGANCHLIATGKSPIARTNMNSICGMVLARI